MSIIVDRKFLWSIGIVLGVIGIIGMVQGMLEFFL